MKGKILYLITLVFVLESCSKIYIKQEQNFTHLNLKDVASNQKVNAELINYKLKVTEETEKTIAFSAAVLQKEGDETTLGNFVCDALMFAAKKEFANIKPDAVLINRGGLRVNLPAGNIKIINVFELMPFENELVLVKITGQKLLDGIALVIEKKHPFFGLFIKADNQKLLEAKINGENIEPQKLYTIITSDYLASGGDSFVFFKNPITTEKSNLKIRDAIINYCIYLSENKKQIIPYTDGRLQISK